MNKKISNIIANFQINPFNIYGMVATALLVVYNFNWSAIYPKLTIETVTFIVFTIVISFIMSILYSRTVNNKIEESIEKSKNEKIQTFNLTKATIFVWCLYIIEFIYMGTVPIFEILSRNTSYSYTSFGVPMLHVFVVTFNSFLAIYAFQRLLVEKNKNNLIIFILNMIPAFLIYNRAMVVLIAFSAISIYVYIEFSGKLRFKNIVMITLCSIIGFYIFGIAGNIRTDWNKTIESSADTSYLMNLTVATEEFRNNWIPKPYYWTYIYGTSPLANFQKTVEQNYDNELNVENTIGFLNNAIIPDFISKRLNVIFDLPESDQATLILPEINVSLMYANAYVHLGWIGAIIIYVYMIIFISSISFTLKSHEFYVTIISILNTMVVFNFFSNSFTFSGILLQLVYPIFIILWNRYDFINFLKFRFKKNH